MRTRLSGAFAQEKPNVVVNQRRAEANCAQCHNIVPGGDFKLYPPSFQAIADYMDPDIMRMKIMYPQHVMIVPQFHTFMFVSNLDNIVGHIQSLDRQK